MAIPTDYAIRVQLTGAGEEHAVYEKLHEVMEKIGFPRTMQGVDEHGKWGEWHLPHAMYFYRSARNDSKFVKLIVETIVEAVWDGKAEVVVFVVSDWSASGLKRVAPKKNVTQGQPLLFVRR